METDGWKRPSHVKTREKGMPGRGHPDLETPSDGSRPGRFRGQTQACVAERSEQALDKVSLQQAPDKPEQLHGRSAFGSRTFQGE